MKNIILTAFFASCFGSAYAADGWVGQLTASTDRVQVGDIPELSWQVDYPSTGVEDVVDIDEETVTPTTKVRADIRLLGAAWGIDTRFYRVNGYFHNGSTWSDIFNGFHGEISQTAVVKSEIVEAGTSLNMAARGFFSNTPSYASSDGTWGSYYISWNTTPNVVLLKNGDAAPQLSSGYAIQQSVQDYLAPYMDGESGTMVLGPRDVVYLFDFNDHGSFGFDLQDFAVLITFTEVE